MSNKLCVEIAASMYLLALDRIEKLYATVQVWPEVEEFMDEAVRDLAWAGRQVELAGQEEEWAALFEVIEELPVEEDVVPEGEWTPEVSDMAFEECCQTSVV